ESHVKPAPSLARVRDGFYRGGIVSLLHVHIRDLVAAPSLPDSTSAPERHCWPCSLRYLGWGNHCSHRFDALGKQSGGHLNPAMTFTFYCLDKVEFWDAIFYGMAQFAGATAGLVIASSLLLGARARESGHSVRCDTPRYVWYWCGLHCRSCHFVRFDVDRFVRLQSHSTLELHAVFFRRSVRDFYNARNAIRPCRGRN